jgi:O-acetyl-ADP-ribose deacetylase (regulator of RNase III)
MDRIERTAIRKLVDGVCKHFDLNVPLKKNEKHIEYVEGDATRPRYTGKKLIIHCCNDKGAWGAGFVLALSKRCINPETQYRLWRQGINTDATGNFELGQVQFCKYHVFKGMDEMFVANMIGQHGTGIDKDGNPPIRYDAIRKCLRKVRRYARKHNMTIHAPRFGSDLAGGKWEIIEKIIEEELTSWGIHVTVYDWKG